MPSEIDTIYGLSAGGGLTPVGPVTTMTDGTPVRRYIKDAIKLGVYVHPVKKWKLSVTEDRMDNWLNNFQAMKLAGVPVKLTKNHEPRTKAESVVGDAVDMIRDGNWLRSIIEVRGQKNIDLVESNKDVSIEIEPSLKDAEGHEFSDCITAISIVPTPVVNGQRGFEPIAASLTADEFPVLKLSLEDEDMKDLFEAIENMCGLKSGDVNADNAVEHVKAYHEKTKGVKLSTTIEPDAKELSLAAKYGAKELDSLDSAKYSPATRDALKELLIGSDKQQSKVMLSLSTGGGDVLEFNERLVKILNGNAPVKHGEQSGIQGHMLSRVVPDDDGNVGDGKPQPTGWEKMYGKAALPMSERETSSAK